MIYTVFTFRVTDDHAVINGASQDFTDKAQAKAAAWEQANTISDPGVYQVTTVNAIDADGWGHGILTIEVTREDC